MSRNKIAKLLLALGIGVATVTSGVAVTGCGNNSGPDDGGIQDEQPTTQYTVTFNLNGGNGSAPASQTVDSGEKLAAVADPTHPDGLEFDGWWTEAEGGTRWDFENNTVTGSFTLYAHWKTEPEEKHTVTFDANGGEFAEGVETEVETVGGKVTAPANPAKSGVSFLGWSAEKNGKELINFRIEKFEEDTTVYAVWYEVPANPDYEDVRNTVNLTQLQKDYGSTAISEDVTVGAVTFPANGKLRFDTSSNVDCVNEQQAGIIFNLQGTVNSITFKAKSASSNDTNIYLYKGSDKNGEEIKDFGKATSGMTEYSIDNLDPGIYCLSAIDAACRYTDISYTQKVLKGAPVSSEVSAIKTDIPLGRAYTANDVSCKVTYLNETSKIINTDLNIDSSNVDTSKAGTYPVRVKYTESGYTVVDEYEVTVHTITALELGTHIMNNGTQTTFKTVYTVGGAFLSNGLTVTGKTASGLSFKLNADEYSAPALVLASEGMQKFTVTASTKVTDGATVSEEIEVYVVAKGNVTDNTISVTVDPSKDVTNGNFKTIMQAIDYVANFSDDVVKEITIADGVYNEKVYINTKNVHLIGSDTVKPDHAHDNGVVIVYDAIAGKTDAAGNEYGTNGSGTVTVKADGFVAENITFKNYYNTAALYDASLKISSKSQAVALTVESNHAIFKGCKLTSYHDTLYANKGYQYYEQCWIEGHTDYIFGQDARAYFNNCDVFSIGATPAEKDGKKELNANGGYVTALKPTSAASDFYFVYNGCRFDADENTADGSVALGRAWGADMKMVVINSTISAKFSTLAHTEKTDKGQRYCTMSGNEPKASNMLEGKNAGAGAVSASIANTCTVDDAYATQYGLDNIQNILHFDPTDATYWTVTVHLTVNGEAKSVELQVKEGVSVTAEMIKEALGANYAAYTFDKIYTWNGSGKGADYSGDGITEATELFVELVLSDLTITENTTFNFSPSAGGFNENIASGETVYYGKLKIETKEGRGATNGDWYKFTGNATITLKVAVGTRIEVVTYDGHLAVTGATGVDTPSNNTYTLTATNTIVELCMESGATQLYIKTVTVTVGSSETPNPSKTVYDKDSTITLTDYEGADIQGAKGEYKGIEIDATNGKFAKNNASWLQINNGTKLKIYVREGATVTATLYQGGTCQIGEYDSADGSVTITITSDTYISVISVKYASTPQPPAEQKSWTVTCASKKPSIEGDDGLTVTFADKSGATESGNASDFKFDGSAAKLTLALDALKAGQTVSITVYGYSGSSISGTDPKEYNPVDLTVKTATNAVAAANNAADNKVTFSGEATLKNPESGTFVYTVSADGAVTFELARVLGSTTRLIKLEITVA